MNPFVDPREPFLPPGKPLAVEKRGLTYLAPFSVVIV
jgi:hypothetical protein